MRKLHFTWGVVLAAIVLVAYAYITFLGMLYRENSTVSGALLTALALFAVVAGCVYVMSMAKAAKWQKVGVPAHIAFASIILVCFVLASFPFTNFMSVWQHSSDVAQLSETMKQDAGRMDKVYDDYVESRVVAYHNSLPADEQLRAISLRRHLAPQGIDSIQSAREQWLSSIGTMKAWNIYMPSNLKCLQDCVEEWRENYISLSSIQYSDEPRPACFVYSEFENSMAELQQNLSHPPFSFLALFIAVLAALIMLIPYLLTPSAPPVEKEDLYEG